MLDASSSFCERAVVDDTFSLHRERCFNGCTQNLFSAIRRHKTAIWPMDKRSLSSIHWSLFSISQLLCQWDQQCDNMGTSLALRVCQGKKAVKYFPVENGSGMGEESCVVPDQHGWQERWAKLSRRSWKCILRWKVGVVDHLT